MNDSDASEDEDMDMEDDDSEEEIKEIPLKQLAEKSLKKKRAKVVDSDDMLYGWREKVSDAFVFNPSRISMLTSLSLILRPIQTRVTDITIRIIE